MSETAPRKTLKQQHAEDQRRLMNQRRQDLTDRIRKKKRAQLIDAKRRYIANPNVVYSTNDEGVANLSDARLVMALKESALAVIQKKDVASLEALLAVLASPNVDANDLFLDEIDTVDDNTLAVVLANTLAASILQTSTTNHECLLACRILTNLAAAERLQTEEGYYGRRPKGWCDVLMQSQAMSTMAYKLAQCSDLLSGTTLEPPTSDEILQQCCWFLGNMAGDSQMARVATRNMGCLKQLVFILHRSLEWKHACLAKNAAWALANIIRGDATSPASTFCSPSLLTPDLLSHGLLAVEQQQQELSAEHLITWWEVVEEVASMVMECTNREDETFSFLTSSSNHLIEALILRIDTSTKILFESSLSSLTPDMLLRHNRICQSCLLAVGNIANGCGGVYVPRLLVATDKSLVQSVAGLIELVSSSNKDLQAIASAAAWVSGVLLCDAGISDHPSTTIAAPVLLPMLCKKLPVADFMLQVEIVSAISNALQDPPALANEERVVKSAMDKQSYVDMSLLIARDSETVMQLIQLLKRTDYTAALSAVRVLGTLLRLAPNFQRHFAEIRGVQSLEECCEQWGGDTFYSRGALSVADLAADLLDAFYSQESSFNDMDDIFTDQPAVSAQGLYAFGDCQSPSTGHSLSPGAPSRDSGRGRGRGRPIPSWMQSSA